MATINASVRFVDNDTFYNVGSYSFATPTSAYETTRGAEIYYGYERVYFGMEFTANVPARIATFSSIYIKDLYRRSVLEVDDFSLSLTLNQLQSSNVADYFQTSNILAGNDTLTLSSYNDVAKGYGGNDIISDRGGNDIIHAGAGNDILYNGEGDDFFYGDSGTDTLHLYGNGHEYTVTRHAGHVQIGKHDGSQTDTLYDIEVLRFDDATINVSDIAIGGTARGLVPQAATQTDALSIARLYEAAFGRQPDLGGLNYWIDSWEDGASMNFVAQSFMSSQEFQNNFGNVNSLSNEQFVTQLYANILDRTPDAGGLGYWRGVLDSGGSREAVLLSFAESQENINGTTYLSGLSETYSDSGYWTF